MSDPTERPEGQGPENENRDPAGAGAPAAQARDEGGEDGEDADGLDGDGPDAEAPAAARPAPLMPPREDTAAGFAALIGAPNAGKSTLLNNLVGSKVSIVSRKVQTTRALVRGIAIEGRAQIVFVDTPGIFQPRRRLDRAMVTSAWGGAGDADVVCFLIDVRKGVDEENEAILKRLADFRQPKILILNKIDTLRRERLLELAQDLNARQRFDHTFMVSALNGDGTDRLKAQLAAMMPDGPWLYPEDQVSDAPLRMLAAEITREKIYERLHEELPYRSTVETDQWQQRADGSVRIEQTIFVERESQRSIVLGKGGQTIKAIGQLARREIAEIAEAKVHLFLFVKVRENWSDDPARYREMGLEFPRE
jgi:GTP-binding protein Era